MRIILYCMFYGGCGLNSHTCIIMDMEENDSGRQLEKIKKEFEQGECVYSV